MEYFRKILVFAENTIIYDVTFSYFGEYVAILFFTFHSCMHELLAYQLHSCLAIHFRCSLFKYYNMTCLKGIPKINCSTNSDLERILAAKGQIKSKIAMKTLIFEITALNTQMNSSLKVYFLNKKIQKIVVMTSSAHDKSNSNMQKDFGQIMSYMTCLYLTSKLSGLK